MTRQKSFKTRVRTRMDKSGESYTTARRQLIEKAGSASERAAAEQPSEVQKPAAADAIKAQQHSDGSVRERTGRGWDEWFSLLDTWGATTHTHTEMARWLAEEHEVDGWWAQSVTVGYEQARGMRAPGQQPDGSFAASGSKTISVPVDRLFEAFADADVREQWLPGVEVAVRTATPRKTFRADWDDSTRIAVGFTAKGDAKAQVALAHESWLMPTRPPE